VYLLSFTGKDFYAAVFPTFIVYACLGNDGDPWTYQSLAAIGIFAALIAAKIMISKGPRFLFALSYLSILATLVAYVIVYALIQANVLPAGHAFWIFIIVSLVYQAARAILEFTPWNVFPFIPDVDRLLTHGDHTGIYASVMTFFRKSTGALASWVAGLLLGYVGFTAAKKGSTGAEIHEYALSLPDSVTHGIAVIFFAGTGLLILLAFIVSRSFRLDRHTHGILKAEIERLEAGGSKADVTPEAKDVAEKLTGHPYETLWPEVATY
jgi:oligogalacturonide transporter